jgi:hypothetical protein
MGEYTDQEIEMLARFDVARYDADDWDTCSDEAKAKDRKAVLSALTSEYCPAVLRAAARLMREAQSHVTIDVKKDGEIRLSTGAHDALLREAREQGRAERTAYHADGVVLASDNLARARADGAEEMRERIVTRLRAFGDPDICDAARSVPVAFDESEKEMRAAMLRRQLSDAGDRHDRDECDRLDAEIAAVERTDE